LFSGPWEGRFEKEYISTVQGLAH